MSLIDEYKRQFAWRDWPTLIAALPPLRGQTVLDLGCGVGDQAALLVERGARVIGIDANEEILAAARSRSLENAQFLKGDLRAIPDLGVQSDGIWASFATAYFVDLPPTLESWATCLRLGGWIALTEIDDLFGHEPLGTRAKELFDAYARDGLAAKRYDFHMGRKLRGHLERAGFTVTNERTASDKEFAFTGPALPEVVAGWRARFERLSLLRDICGAEFERVRDEFLACLSREDHRSNCKVVYCIATR
ncbi:MAG: methyltransferase domain-containing protein [Planctomycetes bacterium]|nr:methyltransferase domain-containing protein [Planctomycetota bacterium]